MTKAPSGMVFISHSSRDREFVEREILQELQRRGVATWYSQADIVTADDWQRTTLSGLERCDNFLVVLSPRSTESPWVRAEVAWAVQHRCRVIPVFMEACDPAKVHLCLLQLQHVDFAHGGTEARERLFGLFAPVEDARDVATQAVMPVRVPLFHFGNWVPPKCFIGRSGQLEEAKHYIQGGHNFLLVGQHRDGKTSLCKMLIHQIEEQPGNTVLLIYFNVQSWPKVTRKTFLEHTILGMIGEISRQVFEAKYSLLDYPDEHDLPKALRQDEHFHQILRIYKRARQYTHSGSGRVPLSVWLEEFRIIHKELLEVINKKGWSKCVVFYDEANRLTNEIPVEQLVSNEEDLTAIPGRISVYAATPAMAEAFGRRLGDTFTRDVKLLPFNEDEVRELLSSYWWLGAEGRNVDLPVHPGAVRQICELTGGQPYRVQLLAGTSFSVAHQKGDSTVSPEHVTAALDRLKKDKPEEFS